MDFTVEEGEIVGVLGHNGMGKTTLLKTIMGIVPATGGVIGYAGLDLTRERASERARLGLGYVPAGTRDLSYPERPGQHPHGDRGPRR